MRRFLPFVILGVTAVSPTWSVDGRPAGTCAPEGSVSWPLEPGPHAITVVDDLGRRDETTILVK